MGEVTSLCVISTHSVCYSLSPPTWRQFAGHSWGRERDLAGTHCYMSRIGRFGLAQATAGTARKTKMMRELIWRENKKVKREAKSQKS